MSIFSTAARIGGHFDQRDELLTRLQQGPGAEVRPALAPPLTTDDPPPAPPAPPTPRASRWRLRTIRDSVASLRDYSLSGVWRVLQRHGLRLRSAQVQHYSPDPAYQSKVDRLCACLQEAAQHPEEVVLVFLDEMGYHRWAEPGVDWAAQAPAPPPVARRGGPNNQQWRIIGGLNPVTGQVLMRDGYKVGRAKLCEFWQVLATAYPQARKIYVVLDNWSIHRHPDVTTALAKYPQLELVWLPTYAPWLNPIEKLWRWLRQELLTLHRGAEQWEALRQQVRDFLAQFAAGSQELLHYVGLQGDGLLAQALKPD